MSYIRKNLIGFLEQQPILANKTVFENIVYDLENYNIQDIKRYFNIFKVFDDSMDKCDDIYNYKIDERLYNISGGQKQKISFIRLLIKNSDLLILDEPTSSIDSLSIIEFKKLLLDLKKHKILILVTHNKEILNICDFQINLG